MSTLFEQILFKEHIQTQPKKQKQNPHACPSHSIRYQASSCMKHYAENEMGARKMTKYSWNTSFYQQIYTFQEK